MFDTPVGGAFLLGLIFTGILIWFAFAAIVGGARSLARDLRHRTADGAPPGATLASPKATGQEPEEEKRTQPKVAPEEGYATRTWMDVF